MAAPTLTILAGPIGSGKTTVFSVAKAGFLQHAPRYFQERDDLALADGEPVANLQATLQAGQSVIVETRLDDPAMLLEMSKAAKLGAGVDLVVVDVEDPMALLPRCNGHPLREAVLERTLAFRHHLAAAVDLAKRIVLIDNSTGLPVVRSLSALDTTRGEPGWFKSRVLATKLEREASRGALQRFRGPGRISPIVQRADVLGGATHGQIVAATRHHVLQKVGDALHVVHDLAFFPSGSPLALATSAAKLITYERDRSPSAEDATLRRESYGPRIEDVPSRPAWLDRHQSLGRDLLPEK